MTDAVDLFAERMGVSRAHAQQVLKQHPETADRLALADAAHDAEMQAAVVAELADLNDVDIADLAASDDPVSELDGMVMSRAERRVRAQLAAHESWARAADPVARTAPAREAFAKSFEDKVDPDRVLPADERARRAEHARKAHFARMALKSAQARRLKRQGG